MAKATRQAFGEALARLGEQHQNIVALDADLSKSTKSDIFAKKFPDRFFEMGIAEANMIGMACGLAFTGKVPFLCSFGCFVTGRYDIIRLSAAYARANIRIVGTHAGIGIGDDGFSQMGLEDVTLMRALPGMGVFQPMDARETELIMEYLVTQWKGPAYLRLTRQSLPDLYPAQYASQPYQPNRFVEIRQTQNAQVVCLATGAAVAEAVQAQDRLKSQGIAMSVWNASCLKPFNERALEPILGAAKFVVTVEDHSVIGGLGSCVAEALAKTPKHPPLITLGVQDVFGESGEPAELYDKFGISGPKIAETVLRRLKL